jgi:hypothetical protein
MIFREELVALMDFKLGLEYREVALRPEHVNASALNRGEILELIEALEAFSEPVEVLIKKRPLTSDRTTTWSWMWLSTEGLMPW